MMVEVLLSLSIASLVIVSAGTAIHGMYGIQNRMVSRWHALLACRSILEYSATVKASCDTVISSGGDRIRVSTVTRPLSGGKIGFIATASWSDVTSGTRESIQLSRIILCPKDTYDPGTVHEFK